MDQMRQRQRTIGLAMQRIGDEPAQIVEPEGASAMSCTGAPPVRMASSLRMTVRGADLVVP